MVAAIAGVCSIASCSKNDATPTANSNQLKVKELKLVAEMTLDDSYVRSELLNLGNVYESEWNERYFEKGEFKHDVNYTTNVLDTKVAIIGCDKDKVAFETEEGDTITLFNIISSGETVRFDMYCNDNSLAHFKFTLGEDVDFVKELQSLMKGNNTKSITLGVALGIVAAVSGVTAATFAIVSYVKSRHDRKCDTLRLNYVDKCHSLRCGAWRGNCCVRCLGGNAYPNCHNNGAVYGEGSDCNNH